MSAFSQSLRFTDTESLRSPSQKSGSTQMTSAGFASSQKSATILSMEERVRNVQEYHKYTLECIEKNAWEKSEPLESTKNYFCVAFDPMEAKHWTSIELIEFENRCRWEQLMRQDAVHGYQYKSGWNRYPNLYTKSYTDGCLPRTDKMPEDFEPASAKTVAHASKALRVPRVLRTTQRQDRIVRTTETKYNVSGVGPRAAAVPFVPLAMQWYEIGRGTPDSTARHTMVIEDSDVGSNGGHLDSPMIVPTDPDLTTTQPLLSTWHSAERDRHCSTCRYRTTVRGRALLKKLNSALQDPVEKSSVTAPFVGEMKRLEDDSWLVYSLDGHWKKATTRLN
ncbi:hypothetical protein LTS08_000218 [Lithohypha guttulata]|nr:hypothetical protein LTS08_000218 [Lithohypha guttulata]